HVDITRGLRSDVFGGGCHVNLDRNWSCCVGQPWSARRWRHRCAVTCGSEAMMHEDSQTGDHGPGEVKAKRAFAKRGLGRAQRAKYQKLYREEYIASHGGEAAGRAALRERNRQQRRSSRTVRYLPLLFETADHRYRLWTWEGPSKLFLKSVEEADGMRGLFVPALRPRVIAYTVDLNRDLRAACKAAAAGIPFQALSDHQRRAYAFLLWNECRGYEFLNDIYNGRDPLAEDSTLRLVSQLLVEALTRPLEYVRFLTEQIKPGMDELVEEIAPL